MPVGIHPLRVSVLIAVFLTACGGGGSEPANRLASGGSTATSPTPGDPTAVPAPVAQAPVPQPSSAVDETAAPSSHFPNGVAAGDVDQHSVVLWARGAAPGPIRFEYGRDKTHLGPPDGAVYGVVQDPSVPVKVLVSGLQPGTDYYYRACRGQVCPYPPIADSPDGREAWGQFRTPHALSAGRKGLTFGVSSCWRADLRPFHGIANAPKAGLDFFVALGDTTYADSDKTTDGQRAKTLDQFRGKNRIAYTAVNATDPNYFAKVRASTALFATIDDHEVVNNFAGGATPDSQRGTCECKGNALINLSPICPWSVCFSPDDDREPSYWGEIRKQGETWTPNSKRAFINDTDLYRSALKAWLEYNPVESLKYDDGVDVDADRPGRIAGKPKLYRYRTFGKDAAMFLLDTRTFRDEPVGIANDLLPLPLTAFDPRRTMLGSEQLEDLLRDLQDAQDKGITWKFVFVSVPMQHMGVFAAPDRFEGYAYERAKILDFIQKLRIANVVFISGDIHGTLVNNLIYHKTPTGLNDLSLPYYSGAWDISTGPAAHPEPLVHSVKSELALNGLLFAHEYPMIGLEFWNSGATERSPLLWVPGVFIPPVPVVLGFNQENRFIPETLKQGRYFATSTNGWTKFEIGTDASRTLTVSTYGVALDDKGWPQPGTRTIVSQFEVTAFGLAGNGDQCRLDRDCASGRCVPLIGVGGIGEGDGLGLCQARNADGELCAVDGQCQSGRCSLFRCTAKESTGSPCLLNRECISGKCRGLPGRRTCR